MNDEGGRMKGMLMLPPWNHPPIPFRTICANSSTKTASGVCGLCGRIIIRKRRPRRCGRWIMFNAAATLKPFAGPGKSSNGSYRTPAKHLQNSKKGRGGRLTVQRIPLPSFSNLMAGPHRPKFRPCFIERFRNFTYLYSMGELKP